MRLYPILCTLLLATTALAHADGASDNLPDNVRRIPPPGITVAEPARSELQSGVDALGKKIGRHLREFEQKRDDDLRFIRTWFEKPLAMGAVAPSGRALARAAARHEQRGARWTVLGAVSGLRGQHHLAVPSRRLAPGDAGGSADAPAEGDRAHQRVRRAGA